MPAITIKKTYISILEAFGSVNAIVEREEWKRK